MPELSPALLIALVIMVSLNAYALLAGADFGGGVWDLLATGPRRDRQRHLIAEAMGPVWEANHVWLILVVVLLFTCFPSVFSRLAVLLHIPLTLMLIGIVSGDLLSPFEVTTTERSAPAALGQRVLGGQPGDAGAAGHHDRVHRGGAVDITGGK